MKVTLYIYNANVIDPVVATSEMNGFGWTLLGTQEVEVDVPNLSEKEIIQRKLDALEAEAQAVSNKADDKLLELSKRKAALLGGGENV